MRIADFWTEHGANPLFNLRRNERRDKLKAIVVEAMRTLATKSLTKTELQRLVHIRRSTFLKLLAALVKTGEVAKTGHGTKGKPYRYLLSQLHRDSRS